MVRAKGLIGRVHNTFEGQESVLDSFCGCGLQTMGMVWLILWFMVKISACHKKFLGLFLEIQLKSWKTTINNEIL